MCVTCIFKLNLTGTRIFVLSASVGIKYYKYMPILFSIDLKN